MPTLMASSSPHCIFFTDAGAREEVVLLLVGAVRRRARLAGMLDAFQSSASKSMLMLQSSAE